jgi:hypothetical protein
MYVAADKYQIKDLKDMALSKFQAAVQRTWTKDLVSTLAYIYESNALISSPLQPIIVTRFKKQLPLLVSKESFGELIHGYGRFGMDLIKSMVNDDQVSPLVLKCPNRTCSQMLEFWLGNPEFKLQCPRCMKLSSGKEVGMDS